MLTDFVGVEDVSSLQALSDANSIAYKLFGAAKYDTDSWIGWNGMTETETTYYNTSGDKIGSSFTGKHTWDENGTKVTMTNTSYNDADWNYLGNEWSDGTDGGWSYETSLTTFDELAHLDLDGNGTKGETGLTSYKDGGGTTTATSAKAIICQKGSDTYSFVDMAGNTVTESVEYTHFFDQSMNHLGGQETRNGETTNFLANFEQGLKVNPYRE